jgi:hypothetical protein
VIIKIYLIMKKFAVPFYAPAPPNYAIIWGSSSDSESLVLTFAKGRMGGGGGRGVVEPA